MVKGIVIGFLLTITILASGFFLYFATGMAPIATGDPPMPFEERLANMAIRLCGYNVSEANRVIPW